MINRLKRLFSLHKTDSGNDSKNGDSNVNELGNIGTGGKTMEERREKNPLKEGSKVPAG